MAKASEAPVVLDIGANLLRPFAHYCAEAGDYGPWGTGGDVSAFAVTTGESKAVGSARAALFHIRQALPDSRRFVPVNERDARFSLASDAPAIKEMVKAHKASGVLRMPACMSPGLAHVVDRHMPLDEAAGMTVEAREKALRVPRLEAVRAARRMVSFLDDGTRAFDGAHGPMADAVPA